MRTVLTSESVCKGHPDKVCDRISDAILDAYMAQDPQSHVAVESVAAYDTLFLTGEVKSEGPVDAEKVARETIKEIGYIREEFGFVYDRIKVICRIHQQSPDIDRGVSQEETGAGDQGIMFGYASMESPEYLDLPYYLSNKMIRKLDEIKKELTYLGPDGKGQVSVEYEDGRPVRIPYVVLSNQHLASVDIETVRKDLEEKVIRQVLPAELLDEQTVFLINPTGSFVVGGPEGDSGLTGRKIIVDTYGGSAPHGGGAFSGKDPTKVDRTAAYYLRYAAKNLVAAGLCERVTLQVGYAIGYPRPVSLHIDAHGTEKVPMEVLYKALENEFDFRVEPMIETLGLRHTQFKELSSYGHFGRPESSFEKTDKVEALKKYLEA